ncbi:hypothetical protein IE81DRAFT_11364 [Ceraceosorus guamensis]|uniref:Uncharacterized protein n=1 Tax=Ceraceosorus guamensis TaxID=1522189 RepID=A0A316W772_9BASI|nr:hypothetical protein IE81DRAFT_11364 [Ceraceosorus guamensis]PWN44581.1 hypothetical protein IE81DRAFT_11364 [Ceraceosorus guamensis]
MPRTSPPVGGAAHLKTLASQLRQTCREVEEWLSRSQDLDSSTAKSARSICNALADVLSTNDRSIFERIHRLFALQHQGSKIEDVVAALSYANLSAITSLVIAFQRLAWEVVLPTLLLESAQLALGNDGKQCRELVEGWEETATWFAYGINLAYINLVESARESDEEATLDMAAKERDRLFDLLPVYSATLANYGGRLGHEAVYMCILSIDWAVEDNKRLAEDRLSLRV